MPRAARAFRTVWCKKSCIAAKKVAVIDRTYRAPATVNAPQDVVFKGVALDGTGRTATLTVRVTP